jgi:hypothetical protein
VLSRRQSKLAPGRGSQDVAATPSSPDIYWQPAAVKKAPAGRWIVVAASILAAVAVLGWWLLTPEPGGPDAPSAPAAAAIERGEPLRVLNPSAPRKALRRSREAFELESPPPRMQPPPRRGPADYMQR